MRNLTFSSSYPDPLAPAENHAVRALAESYNDFGQTIFGSLAKQPGNIVYSPYSAGVGFAMAMSGARGATQAEFLDVMRLPGQPSDIEAANGRLGALLANFSERRDREARGMGERPLAELAIANLIALTSPDGRLLVAPEYRELLRKRYDAEVFENAAPATIDAWAAARTRGKIPRVANWDSRSPPGFVLLNAIYFNGRWEQPFHEAATTPLPFAIAAGQRVDVPTMRNTANRHYLEGDRFKAIWLPYRPDALGMVIVLPDQGVAPNALAGRLASEGLPALAERLLQTERTLVELQLPRFSTRFNASLRASAQAAGLRLPFERERADFGGVTGRSDEDLLFVDDARQQATVDVTEEGTRATSMFGVLASFSCARAVPPPPPTPFHVDRPFLFYILDRSSDAILFQGRIDDPRSGQDGTLTVAGGGRISRVDHRPSLPPPALELLPPFLLQRRPPADLGVVNTQDAKPSPSSMGTEEAGDLYDRAVAIVLRDRKCSMTYIQCRLSLGHGKAAALVERMEKEGIVSPPNHSGQREVLVGGDADLGAFDTEAKK